MTNPPKSLVATLYSDLDTELKLTRRMLERYPAGHADWRPHEKSMPLGRLAAHVAELPRLGSVIVNTDELDFAKQPPAVPGTYATADELVAVFDTKTSEFRKSLDAMDSEKADSDWTIRQGDKVFFSRPKAEAVRHLLINHLVHHRAQLGVYYRMLDIPLPGSYGPSADEAM